MKHDTLHKVFRPAKNNSLFLPTSLKQSTRMKK